MDGYGWPKRERHGEPPPQPGGPPPPQQGGPPALYDPLRRAPMRALPAPAPAYSYPYDGGKKDGGGGGGAPPMHHHAIQHAPHPQVAHHGMYARPLPPLPQGYYAPHGPPHAPPAAPAGAYAPAGSYAQEYYRGPPPGPAPPMRAGERPHPQAHQPAGHHAPPASHHPAGPHGVPHRQHMMPPREMGGDPRTSPQRMGGQPARPGMSGGMHHGRMHPQQPLAPPPHGGQHAPQTHAGQQHVGQYAGAPPPHPSQPMHSAAPQPMHATAKHEQAVHAASAASGAMHHQMHQARHHPHQSAPMHAQRQQPMPPASGHMPGRSETRIDEGVNTGATTRVKMPPTMAGSIPPSMASGIAPTMAPGDGPPPSNGGPAGDRAGGEYRQLKVEDALMYLEQVKSQFADNPTVYNQFLDIMKEFKAQSIDTGEVIRRVSSLFHGHRALILGFNTFLPPGYKIEQRDDPNTGHSTMGFSAPGGAFSTVGEGGPTQPNGGTHLRSAGMGSMPPGMAMHHQQQHPHQTMPAHSGVQMHQGQAHQAITHQQQMAGMHPQHAAHSHQMQAHADAQAKAQAKAHAQQAQAMHAQQAQGHPQQVYGAQGRASQPPPQGGAGQQPSAMDMQHRQPMHPGVHGAVPISAAVDGKASMVGGDGGAVNALAGGFGSPTAGAAATEAGKPIEFEQAVTYVNKIKSRFFDDEAVYKRFLDILQTYQKEQRTIKQVYKQVSELFRDHTDLLEEFSHFLPEGPQPAQRAGGHHTAMSGSMDARGYQALGPRAQYQELVAGGMMPRVKNERITAGIGKPGAGGRKNTASSDGVKKPRRGGSSRKGNDREMHMQLLSDTPPAVEMEFFEELQKQLGESGKPLYTEIIKSVSLMSQEIICAEELMRLIDSIMVDRKWFSDAFRILINHTDPHAAERALGLLRRGPMRANGVEGAGINPVYAGRPLSQVCRDYGEAVDGNYAAYPSDLGGVVCSGMNAGDRSVLNFACASRGRNDMRLMDTPGGLSNGVGSPRSPTTVLDGVAVFDGNLSVDDQRTEMDVLISRVEVVIGKMERIVAGERASLSQMDNLPIEIAYKGATGDMQELLRANPTGAAPLVLVRLRELRKEWMEARGRLEAVWRTHRFKEARSNGGVPKRWTRGELVAELVAERAADVSPNGGKGPVKAKTVRSRLLAAEANRELVLDLLWYILEWLCETAEEAEASAIMVNRVYALFIESEKNVRWFIADEHLYAFVRLLAAVSVRVDFILRNNPGGTTVGRTVGKVKDLLSGGVGTTGFEGYCREVYGGEGDDGTWKELLSDFGVVLKRFGAAAKRLPGIGVVGGLVERAERQLGLRFVAEDVEAEEEGKGGEEEGKEVGDTKEEVTEEEKADGEADKAKNEKDEKAGEEKVEETAGAMEVDTKADKPAEGGKVEAEKLKPLDEMAYIRECMRLTEDCGCEMFRVDVASKLVDNEPEAHISISHLPRTVASQHPLIDDAFAASTETDGKESASADASEEKRVEKNANGKDGKSKYTRYVERRGRKRAAFERVAGIVPEIRRGDGLAIRYDVENEARMYVNGTEDFFENRGARMRKMRRIGEAARKVGEKGAGKDKEMGKGAEETGVGTEEKMVVVAEETGGEAAVVQQAS